MTPAQAPLPTDCSLPFHFCRAELSAPPAAGSQTSIWIFESADGLTVAATRQKAGRFVIGRAGGPPAPFSGGVNVPPFTDSASVIVVRGSESDFRLSQVAAAAAPLAPATTAIVIVNIRPAANRVITLSVQIGVCRILQSTRVRERESRC